MADQQAGRSPARSEAPRALGSREPSEGASWRDVPVELPATGRMTAFALDGLELVLVNAAGTPCVIEDACPHAEAALSEGRLEGFVLECPLHGGKLDVRDGSPVAAPIRRPARTFAVRRNGDRIQMELPANP